MWCRNVSCSSRLLAGDKGGRWWRDYGCCSRECAEEWYGDDVEDE